MRTGLLRIMKNVYSQEAKKNVFKLPLKQLIPYAAQMEAEEYIHQATNCNVLAVALKDNIEWFTQNHIYLMFKHLRTYNLDIDHSFHSIIVPITLEYIKVFNREQSLVFYEMAMTMLQLQIDNTELWTAILNKLDEENIYRYIPLYETSQLLQKLLDNPSMRDHSLTRKLITVIHQQKLFYLAHNQSRPVIANILKKLENIHSSDPQLTEAYKQLV